MQQGIPLVFRRPVIPVLTIDDPAAGVALARALSDGGLDVLEITLRTAAALDAVSAIASALPRVLVGVGTVNTPLDFERAAAAGARFAVSPGVTPALLEAAPQASMPWLPGAATVSESMRLLEAGIAFQKLFPAAPVGGIDYLNGIWGPLPEVTFCPTGGVSASNAPGYLQCPNVACVGGSWVAPKAAIAAGDWAQVQKVAATAASLDRTWRPDLAQ